MLRILLLFIFFISVSVQSGEVKSTIKYMQVVTQAGSSNFAVVNFDSNPTNSPACASDPRFTIDFSISGGRELFSLLLAAHMAKKQVHLWGTGQCSQDSTLETASFARVF